MPDQKIRKRKTRYLMSVMLSGEKRTSRSRNKYRSAKEMNNDSLTKLAEKYQNQNQRKGCKKDK